MKERRDAALAELQKLWTDLNAIPINYDLYCTNPHIDTRKKKHRSLFQSHQGRTTGVDAVVAGEVLDAMMVLYKLQLKIFLVNLTTQVVERHFLNDLETIFLPTEIAKLSNDEIRELYKGLPLPTYSPSQSNTPTNIKEIDLDDGMRKLEKALDACREVLRRDGEH